MVEDIEKALNDAGIDHAGGAAAYNLRDLLTSTLDVGRTFVRREAEMIESMCECQTTLDALVYFGVRLGDVVARAGSWNIRATGRFHKVDPPTVAAAADALDATDRNIRAIGQYHTVEPPTIAAGADALDATEAVLKSKRVAIRFKAARVQACALAEHWDAFTLQEAPPYDGADDG